jgi:hypothetical protein
MTDNEKHDKDEGEESTQPPADTRPKTVREVVVKHLDEPPPSGKQAIHPRRQAPIVPTREQRTENEKKKTQDKNSEKTDSQ